LAVKLQATKKETPTANTKDSIHTFINNLLELDGYGNIWGFAGVFFLKRGMGKLWDSMYYLIGGSRCS